MYLVINKWVTAVKVSNFSGHYLRNHSTLDIGVLGYIGFVQHKEHSPGVLSIPPGTLCIYRVLVAGLFGGAPVRAPDSPYGICHPGTGWSPSLSVFPFHYHSIIISYSSSSSRLNLPGGKTDEAWQPSNMTCCFGNPGVSWGKCTFIAFTETYVLDRYCNLDKIYYVMCILCILYIGAWGGVVVKALHY